ncbi:MAG: lactate racemase domain-containing protein [Actinomycetota bacterium]
MSSPLRLRTAAWYGDREIELTVPDSWDVQVFRPDTPSPLGDEEIAAALDRPVGQAPIAELARGKARPVILVDDLTRPTPVGRILPHVIRQFELAGVPAARISVVVGTGSHPPPPPGGVERKLGAASGCRVIVHDCTRDVARIGATSFGTPVVVNRDVLAGDFLVGIGGVYPQHSTGFGGGSKLALGALGKRSIIRLHYGHESGAGSVDVENPFRRDLDEIARMIGLGTVISTHVDANREIVRIVAGDPAASYRDEAAFALASYRAPHPDDADVVIANAYPIDTSLTFVRSKGLIPLFRAAPGASRIVIAACSEGVGHHGLFPFVTGSRLQRPRHAWRTVRARPGAVPGALARRASSRLRRTSDDASGRHPVWLYRPEGSDAPLPAEIPGIRQAGAWGAVLERVAREQGPERPLRVAVYPCAPLQVLGG